MRPDPALIEAGTTITLPCIERIDPAFDVCRQPRIALPLVACRGATAMSRIAKVAGVVLLGLLTAAAGTWATLAVL